MMQKSTKYKISIWVSALMALVYVFIPADFSPDVVPVIGWIDDLIAILLAVTNGLVLASKLKNHHD